MEWKDVGSAVLKAAPMLGTLIGGPVGIVVGAAAKIAGDALGVDATPDAIAQAIQADPSAALKLREAEMAHAARLQDLANQARRMEIEAATAETQVQLEETRALLSDVQSARTHHATDKNVFWLGVLVLLIFLSLAVLAMVGIGHLLVGDTRINPDILATATGIVGTLIGYLANNAQQVIAFYFGSSKGSSDKTTALAMAVSGASKP